MTVARFAVSFEPDLARAVRRAAGDEPMSAWLADAARRKLRAEGLLEIVQGWEEQHGPLSASELRAAERKLSRPRSIRKKRPARGNR
jgi:hypothetical protein